MALSFDVCRTRDAEATVSVDNNKVDSIEKRSWSINYRVIAEGIEDPFAVSEISVMRAEGIPLLKNSVYVDPSGQIFPYFSCVSKTATRNPTNPFVFDVACEYVDDTGEDGQELQQNVTDYEASIKWSVKSRQRSSWVDINDKPYVLPTGSKFKQGLKLDYACLVATVTQLELGFTASQLKDRMLKLNNASYNGIRAGAALVTDIKYETVKVPVGIAGLITDYITAQRVQYTIEENTLTVNAGAPMGAQGACVDQEYEIDWKQARPLIDSLVKHQRTGKIVATTLLGPNVTNVYLRSDGTLLHSPNVQNGNFGATCNFSDALPALELFDVYEETDFSFLRK